MEVQRWLQENNTLIPFKRRCCLGAGNMSEGRERDLQLLGYCMLCNESFSAFGSATPHPSLGAHQRMTMGKVCSLWDSLYTHL